SQSSGQNALELLWAWQVSGGFEETAARTFLEHADPFVRLWTVRLLGDKGRVTPETADKLTSLAAREPNLELRAQLACTPQRLPAAVSLPLLHRLLVRDEDADDARQPLLCWWALEKKCDSDRDAVLRLFEDSTLWGHPLVQRHLLSRLMRRYAAP